MLSNAPLPPDIVRRIRADFAEPDIAAVIQALQSYTGPEPDRVRRCILHLAARALDKVTHFASAANGDYRDVLFWAEYDRDDRRVRDFSRAFE